MAKKHVQTPQIVCFFKVWSLFRKLRLPPNEKLRFPTSSSGTVNIRFHLATGNPFFFSKKKNRLDQEVNQGIARHEICVLWCGKANAVNNWRLGMISTIHKNDNIGGGLSMFIIGFST